MADTKGIDDGSSEERETREMLGDILDEPGAGADFADPPIRDDIDRQYMRMRPRIYGRPVCWCCGKLAQKSSKERGSIRWAVDEHGLAFVILCCDDRLCMRATEDRMLDFDEHIEQRQLPLMFKKATLS
jgi:hypothetical protein